MSIRASVNSKNPVRRKLALVIGIGNYDEGRNVPNAINDAKKMSVALKSIGFIIYGNEPQLNLRHQEMSDTLAAFKGSIRAGDMVLFYFAGHGQQLGRNNYLIPSNNSRNKNKQNAPLSDSDLLQHEINAQHFREAITDQNPFVIIFLLDCCRIDPSRNEDIIHHDGDALDKYSRSLRSLPANAGPVNANARSMTSNAGYVIAFACAPGTTADDGIRGEKNGLFTKHILKHILKPNEDVEKMLRKVGRGVWEESGEEQLPNVDISLLEDNIYLYEQVTVAPEPRPTPRFQSPEPENVWPTRYHPAPQPPIKPQDVFGTLMNMMMAPTRSNDGRRMDEDGYFNADGSRSFS